MATKRGPIMKQGSKLDPSTAISSDEDLAPRASAAQIASRKIAQPKRRLGASRSVSPVKGPSMVDSIGNPFAPTTQNAINGMNNQAPGGSLFGQQQQQQPQSTPFGATAFGSTTSSSFPTGNSNQGGGGFFFGQSSNSFPPSQQQQAASNGLGKDLNTGFTGFTFQGGSNNLSNPFATAKTSNNDNTPSKPAFSGSIFNVQPTNNSYSPYVFGKQPDPNRKEIKDATTDKNIAAFSHNSNSANGQAVSPQKTMQPKEFGSPGDTMQISPPVTPGRGAAALPATQTSSLFDRINSAPSTDVLGNIESAAQQPAPSSTGPSSVAPAPAPTPTSNLFSLSNGPAASTGGAATTPQANPTTSTQNFFASLNAGSSSTTTTPSNPFASLAKPAQTPATSSNLFGASSMASSTPATALGQQQTPGTRRPDALIFGSGGTEKFYLSESKIGETPSQLTTYPADLQKPKPNIFGETPSNPSTTTSTTKPDTNIFGQTPSNPSTSSSTAKPMTNIFSQPSSNIFQQAAASSNSTPSNIFTPTATVGSKSSVPATPAVSSIAQQPAQPQQPSTSTASILGDSGKTSEPLEKDQRSLKARIRSLNSSYLHALMNMDKEIDWSPLAKAYLSSHANLTATQTAASSSTPAAISRKRKDAPMDETVESSGKKSRHGPAEDTAAPSAPTPGQSSTSNLFQNILGNSSQRTSAGSVPSTPQSNANLQSAPSLFAPKTAPAKTAAALSNHKRIAALPGTVKESSETTQKSPAANPFASIRRSVSPTKPTDAPQPQETSSSANGTAATNFQTGATPSFGANTTSSSSSSADNTTTGGGFKPTFVSGASSGGFTPTFVSTGSSATGTDFMAQFAQQAAKTAAKEKKRRRDEDYDSEEETEAEWEARDAENQRKLREESEKSSKGMIAKFVPGEGFVMERSDDSRDNSEVESTTKKENLSRSPLAAANQAPRANAFAAFAANIRTSQSPSVPSPSLQVPSASNIFAHLSDGNSSAHGDDEDSDSDSPVFTAGEQKQLTPTRRKRKSDDAKDSPLDSDPDTLESAMQKSSKKSKPSPKTPSVLNAAEQPSGNIGKSLFDRISPAGTPSNSDAASSSNEATSQGATSNINSLDGNASPAPLSPAGGDHTWKPSTPIKFGQSLGNPTVNITSPSPEKPKANGGESLSANSKGLFGSSTTPVAGSLFGGFSKSVSPFSTSTTNTAETPSKPSPAGFSFGATPSFKPSPASTNAAASSSGSNPFSFLAAATASNNSALSSRAASPNSTAASGSEAAADEEGAAEPKLAQVDLTSLTEQEQKTYEVLFEVPRAKSMRSIKKDDKTIWDTKGTGPVRVLKNKETGAVHMQGRAAPSGKLFLNSALNKNIEYTHAGKGMAQIFVMDDQGKPERNIIRMTKDEDVKNFVKVLEENK